MTKAMTKAIALANFKQDVYLVVIEVYGLKDKAAMRLEWHTYTDRLCRDQLITMKQYETWTSPF